MFEVSESQCLGDGKAHPKPVMPLKVNHLNVLYGAPLQKTILGKITQDDVRLELVVQEVLDSKSFFYGLNEVVEKLRQRLLSKLKDQQVWVSDAGNQPIKLHNCFIVARHPFILVKRHRRQIAIFEIDGKPLIICSLHLTAYESQSYQDKRRAEMIEIMNFFHQPEGCISVMNSLHSKVCGLIREAVDRGNVFITGDLNLHALGETDIVYENGLQDIWMNLHKLKEGYTWDSKSNSMIRLVLPFDNRRMRLDRMLSLPINPKTDFIPSEMSITHQEPLTTIKAPVLGTHLCLSDHYGLQMSLTPRKPGPLPEAFNYYLHRSGILLGRSPSSTGYRTISQIIAIRISLICIALLSVFFVCRLLSR